MEIEFYISFCKKKVIFGSWLDRREKSTLKVRIISPCQIESSRIFLKIH